MVREQFREVRAPCDRVAREILASREFSEAAVRTANPRTLEIVDVGIGQQMQSRRQLYDLDLTAAIVGDERRLPRRQQKIEGVVVARTLTREIMRCGGGARMLQRVEAKQSAGSQIRVVIRVVGGAPRPA